MARVTIAAAANRSGSVSLPGVNGVVLPAHLTGRFNLYLTVSAADLANPLKGGSVAIRRKVGANWSDAVDVAGFSWVGSAGRTDQPGVCGFDAAEVAGQTVRVDCVFVGTVRTGAEYEAL